ncbi:dTDP-4-amino-4,6-dideoxyglucose [Rhizobiales bacterium GAS191]|nr:dTDP-4-amino-4,6-dideoxyglucose [Rhizobiales bacterium GAS191]
MIGKPSLAVLGAKPRIREPLPVGQFYWPAWEYYERAARDIFARRFYTSQRFAGPLVVEFQLRLQEFLGVKHAIALRTATNGLMIVAHTLGLRGKVIVPSWTSLATVQSLAWSHCEPVFCDIDLHAQQMSCESVKRLLEGADAEGILGVHLWGNAAPVRELEALAREFGVALYYDAGHAFGCRVSQRAVGTFGRAEVLSFNAANILSTAEGGCITTNDDELADKIIAMRGDEVSGTGVAMQSATARMSEMQAAIGLLVLDEFDRNRQNNKEQHDHYVQKLIGTPGMEILRSSSETSGNFQSFVALVERSEFGLTRDELLAVLRAENVAATKHFSPPSHTVKPFSEIALDRGQLQNTELAAQQTLQFPVGARVTAEHIEQICDIVREAHTHSKSIRSVLAPLAVS